MKKTSGITLITLVLTIVILIIIIGAGIGIGVDNLNVKKLNNLYTDIKSLNDSISVYYSQYGVLPLKEKFTGNYQFAKNTNPNDDPDGYYVIDINKLDKVVLTKEVEWTENDVYVINTKTHTVYYPEGVELNGENYYRLPGDYSLIVGMEIVMSIQPEGLTNGDVVLKISWPDNTTGFSKQVSIDGGETWQEYSGDLTIKENCVVIARVQDTQGVTIVEEKKAILNIDKTSPSAPTIAGGGTEWAPSVTITVNGKDSDIQYYEYYISKSATPPTLETIATGRIGTTTIDTSKTFDDRNYNGEYVYIRAVDDTNNKGEWSAPQILYVDIEKPTVVFEPDGGTRYVMPSSGTAKIRTTVTASDEGGSNLSTVKYAWSQNGITAPTEWTSFTNGDEISKTDITEVGTWYLWIKATDIAGNITEKKSKAFVIGSSDEEENSIKIEPQIKVPWTNQPVEVEISFGENLVKDYTITVTGQEGIDYTIDETTNTVTIKTNNQTITVTASDSEGNEVTESYVVSNIDLILPTIAIEPNGGTGYVMPSVGNATIKATATASDEGGSNISTVEYTWTQNGTTAPTDETEWTGFTNGTEISKNDIKEAGTWYLWIKAIDGAGNITENRSEAFEIGSNTETTNSIQIIKLTEDEWTVGPVELKVNYGENLAKNHTITVTGQEGTDYTINETTNIVTIKTNNQKVTATATDKEGNTVTATCTVSNIDPNPPTVSGVNNLTIVGDNSGLPFDTIFNYNQNGIAPIESIEYTNVATGEEMTNTSELTGGQYEIKCKVTKANKLTAEAIANVTIVLDGTVIPDGEEVPEQYVARIGNAYYITLQGAINAVPADNQTVTVTLLKDVTETVTINENQNVIIDLNGNTVSYQRTATLVSYGTSKIQNGTVTSSNSNAIANYGALMELPEGLTATSNNLPAVANMEGATMNITGASITATTGNGIRNDGNVNINGNTTITTTSGYALANNATGIVTMSSGTINNSNTEKGIVNSGGTITIEGTTQINAAVANEAGGTFNMNGGNVAVTKTNGLVNYGTINVSGTATVTSSSLSAIYNYDSGEINISGGKITSASASAITNKGIMNISGNSEMIANTASYYAIYNENQMTISGGTISNSTGPTIGNKGTAEIKGSAEIICSNSSNVAVYNENQMTISGGKITAQNGSAIRNVGTVEITGSAEIICNSSSYVTVYNENQMTISGGKITAQKGSMITNLAALEIKGTAELTAKGTGALVVSNKEGGTATISGGTLISEAGGVLDNSGTMDAGGEVKIISNATVNYLVVNNRNTGNLTISGGEYNVVYAMVFNNLGEMTITAPITITTSSQDNAAILNENGAKLTVVEAINYNGLTNIVLNKGELTVCCGAVLHSTGNGPAICNESTGTTLITGGTVISEKTNTINNEGILTIEGTSQITSTGEQYPTIYNKSGTTTINGGVIENTADGYAIYKEAGEVIINGGTIITKTNLGEANLSTKEGVLFELQSAKAGQDYIVEFVVPKNVKVLKMDLSYWSNNGDRAGIIIGRDPTIDLEFKKLWFMFRWYT